ncbi:MAG TPA: hypothetical protein VLE53_08945 [Gemmatimonadaceae bacterium]|nr:hypothetical protein [Gemmatimonadaceae bacterium]
MSSPFRSHVRGGVPLLVAVVVSVLGVSAVTVASRRPAAVPPAPPPRICADPSHLPFSNDRRGGLDNRIAETVAHDPGRAPPYYRYALRRGFDRETLDAGHCVVIAVVRTS